MITVKDMCDTMVFDGKAKLLAKIGEKEYELSKNPGPFGDFVVSLISHDKERNALVLTIETRAAKETGD